MSDIPIEYAVTIKNCSAKNPSLPKMIEALNEKRNYYDNLCDATEATISFNDKRPPTAVITGYTRYWKIFVSFMWIYDGEAWKYLGVVGVDRTLKFLNVISKNT
jgi:hypothetical protein